MKTLAQIFILAIVISGCMAKPDFLPPVQPVSPTVTPPVPVSSSGDVDIDPHHGKPFLVKPSVTRLSAAQPNTVIQSPPVPGNAFTYSVPLTNCWIELSTDLVHWRNANENYDYTMSTNSDGSWSLIPNMNLPYAFYRVFGEQLQ